MKKYYSVNARNMTGIANLVNEIAATRSILSAEVISVVGQPGTSRLQALISVQSVMPHGLQDKTVAAILACRDCYAN